MGQSISLPEFAHDFPLVVIAGPESVNIHHFLFATDIIANLPQLWLTLGYLLWNNQITRM